jgi:WD40 repeat protein
MSPSRLAVPLLVLCALAVPGPAAHAGLFVSNFFINTVLEYDSTTGAFVKTFASGGGLTGPQGLVFGPNGDLFVSGAHNNAVLEYNGTTGAFVQTFASGGLTGPSGLVFGPNGDLFVSGGIDTNAVLEYNGTTGDFVKTFTSGGDLDSPTYLTFGPSVSAVPEPPGLLLAALGALAGLASAARRRAADFFRPAKP